MGQQTTTEGDSRIDTDHAQAERDVSTKTETESGADGETEDEHLLAEAAGLETDCAGWTAIDQVGAAFANWIDDPDDPVYGVSVMSTGKSIPPAGYDEIPTRKGSFGATYTTAHRRVSGYKLVAGPTNTEGGTSEVIGEWYGRPKQTPREVGHDIYLDVVRRARAWLHAHSPQSKRNKAIINGCGPDRFPDQEADTGENQGTLVEFDNQM